MLLLLFERNVSARLQRKINYLLNGGTVKIPSLLDRKQSGSQMPFNSHISCERHGAKRFDSPPNRPKHPKSAQNSFSINTFLTFQKVN